MLLGATGLLIVAIAFGVVLVAAHLIEVWTDPRRRMGPQTRDEPGGSVDTRTRARARRAWPWAKHSR